MSEDGTNPELDERWQAYLRRRRRGKYLFLLGCIMVIVSLIMRILPMTVAAFSGTVYVPMPWEEYMLVGVVFGIFLILAGVISRIAPNMMEGDALWIMKMGPFGKGR